MSFVHRVVLHLPILISLITSTLSSPHSLTTILDTKHQAGTCAALPTGISSAYDFVAKTRATPGVCSRDEVYHRIFRRADDYACDEHTPCSNGACCAKTGYCNYGPEACGTNGQSPNDKCWSNCDAHAECGINSLNGNATCPLNVCCSKYGFCGATADFCGDGCQSNCNQPSSGGSNGTVQQRIIGYYEGWNINEKCIGMGLADIPVRGITHLHLAFASLTPEFDVIPMDGLSSQLFSDITSLKTQNTDLKVIISIGGWSFSDNGTKTQNIFPDMVSTTDKRSTAIQKVLSFMRQYAFDGVDYDWEYPGAPDRGGSKADGPNFTSFLEELRTAIKAGSKQYSVSFTAPTSYWYLQHFDLKASVDAVDWVSVMSYDLHGLWDANDPIGNHVMAHTNLSEIKDALDLFWRSNVPADKLNLGLGFYGRSFQLSDPKCTTPGCLFKAGATPGPCTKNSGTLSYSEIQDVISQHSLEPVYDMDNAVKYIVWDNDQWASFDDKDTFQQKIKFANDLGMGGLLIWSLDLDTPQLDALQGVIYPKTVSQLKSAPSTANNWNEANGGDCRATDCGTTSCRPGETLMTTTQCDGDGHEFAICCPLAAAPNPKHCSWQGTAPFCNGQCLVGQVALASSYWGDGHQCMDGRKFYCCDIEDEALRVDCGWRGCGDKCAADETQLTWRYGDCWDSKQPFCCKSTEEWSNCAWHGEPDSCYDDHCDTGKQVEMANSYEGEGQDCGWQDRTRVFCCDPPADSPPFLPVDLDYLFPHPPSGDSVKVEYDLKTDDTFGGTVSAPFADDPNDAAFGFVVLTSPDTIQTTLNKRDGSHWDVFDCFDAVTEGEHTVRMVCTDDSETSNCHKIYAGNGVPGTILEMPDGCGPGKYAVAVDLEVSANQILPQHLNKRDLPATSKVYDLRFDYNFARVPRDLGDTQMRIDFANEDGYWDKVVNKAASKRKRDADQHLHNKKRWLEEAWREDKHLSGLSDAELHKRWFGSDVITWLIGIVNGVTGGPKVSHSYKDDFTAILLQESWACQLATGVNAAAKLDVRANVHVGINTNFGLTLIATLPKPGQLIDLSNSYLYFRNDGEVTAKFTLDALAAVNFDTGEMTLFSADKFGAAFSVPGIVVIGPNFKLNAQVEAGISLSAHLEANVAVAKWDVRQTFPDANSDWDPKATEDIDPSGTQELATTPPFDASIAASGFITAYLRPLVTFGIEFNKNWIPIEPAGVNLVTEGFVTAYADASASISAGTSFCYGVDAGMQMYASVDVPEAFGWKLPQTRFQIGTARSFEIVPQTCYPDADNTRRSLLSNDTAILGIEGPYMTVDQELETGLQSSARLERRAQVYGPILHLPSDLLQCPGTKVNGTAADGKICTFCADAGSSAKRADGPACALPEAGDTDQQSCYVTSGLSRRSHSDYSMHDKHIVTDETYHDNHLAKRSRRKYIQWQTTFDPNVPDFTKPLMVDAGAYPECAEATNTDGIPKFYTFGDPKVAGQCDGTVAQRSLDMIGGLENQPTFQTDHIYEIQTAMRFMQFLQGGQYDTSSNGYNLPAGYSRASLGKISEYMTRYIMGFEEDAPGIVNGKVLWTAMVDCFGQSGTDTNYKLALVHETVNNYKGKFFKFNNVYSSVMGTDALGQVATHQRFMTAGGVFSYLNQPEIWKAYKDTSTCLEKVFWQFDQAFDWNNNKDFITPPNPGQWQGKSFNYGLRTLYCGWIDAELQSVEATARTWQRNAKQSYETAFPPDAPNGNDAETADHKRMREIAKDFLDNIMGGTGALDAGSMRFPVEAASTQSSKYGVWGSPDLPPPRVRSSS